VDEAPACVQACPNEAIAIRVVDMAQIIEDVQGDAFLPGAPSPGITLPTTEYKTKRVFPKNTLPADFYNVRPASNHLPLVVLLVLNQLSVGAFSVDYIITSFYTEATIHRYHSLVALALGLTALAASVFHLGRPRYGFRAIIGFKHSWMSREIAFFGAFAGLAVLYAAGGFADTLLGAIGLPALEAHWAAGLRHALGGAVALTGLCGVACSAMLYAVTRRVWWRLSYSGPRFVASTALLGLSTTLVVFCAAAFAGEPVPGRIVAGLYGALMAVAVFKLLFEASIFSHLRLSQVSDLKRTALLMWGELAKLTQLRFALGIVGGLVLPFWLSSFVDPTVESLRFGTAPIVIAAVSWVCLLVGELVERSLFFMAAASPKMPGAVGR
jgi:DMSO reductase anchor subunit